MRLLSVHLIILLGIIGCAKKGTTQNVNDALSNFDVTKLFKKDNCNVYRFYDAGRYHYFTDCTETISTQHHLYGKTIHYTEENIK